MNQNDVNHLSEEETKHFLTPFAFKMDKSLFGLPLASPSKRGVALLIDLALIASLSAMSAFFLALAISITLYRLSNKKRALELGKSSGYKRRVILRFIAALLVFITLFNALPPLLKKLNIDSYSPEVILEDQPLSFGQSMAITTYAISAISTISESDCEEFTCWQEELTTIAKTMAKITAEGEIALSTEQLDDIFVDASKATELTNEEQRDLVMLMTTAYNNEFSAINEKNQLNNDLSLDSTVPPKVKSKVESEEGKVKVEKIVSSIDEAEVSNSQKSDKPVYSVVEWVKGIISDLGLGFGWATFYFTVFITFGHGQTIGKKLMGIKVIQLDGTSLSLWDSFGRYGGYGAGLATGLLGFIQIYWDANRQAIHDKISATVVIDIKKPSKQLQTNQQSVNDKVI